MTLRTLALAALAALASLAAATAALASPLRSGGAVYVLSNGTAGNAVLVYSRAADGSLAQAGSYDTGGVGTGAGLGDQGSLVLSAGGRYLFAVNAASNSLSELQVTGNSLKLRAVVPSNGTTPLSVTVHGDLLYVLNGSGSISGYRLSGNRLDAIPGSTRSLGAGTSGPAQIQFGPDGSWLAVTEKGSSTIDTFAIDAVRRRRMPRHVGFGRRHPIRVRHRRVGPRARLRGGRLGVLVLGRRGRPRQRDQRRGRDAQAAPCWLIASKDGRFAYTANAGAGNISRFSSARTAR